jgi:hypothetical protein
MKDNADDLERLMSEWQIFLDLKKQLKLII